MFSVREFALSVIVIVRMTGMSSLGVQILIKEDKNTAGRFAVTIESMWKSRNDLIWNNERENDSRVGWLAHHNWQEWLSAQRVKDNNNGIHQPLNWNPPPQGWCLRDDLDNFIAAGVAWDPGNLSVLEAEALALKEAIQGFVPLNLGNIIFESDSLGVVQAFHSVTVCISKFYTIIKDIQLLLQNFPNFEVKFVKRQANMVAHLLAKAANSYTRRSIMHVIPPCIELLIMNEKS
ncbi:uncharacterized protein LOC131598074 [Vicia villosa]|uniref:uncharacterized protein LOC131598074 n=1 Tax=Vicia villosa TaxID=3911 RepID=UPI00273B5780|nr:uncharacterized protein LOC131598074 [Vicia villosa]